ncbi:MAG: protoporphyrinogen oxidase [Phycisphaerae bacterium]|nr:protoporphyrinogen oxidase [Phycisphaerae bacterium]
MNESDRDVVVIGAGISGLTVACELKKADVNVGVFEAEGAVGGCTRSERRGGFLLEKGPFNVIVRDPAFETLLDEFSDVVGVVSANRAARKRYLYRGGRLLAVPTSPMSLATTRLLSIGAKVRFVTGLIASPRAAATEETIEQVAARRFGQEVADTFVSAVVAGVFAGDIRRLSLKACFPSAARFDRDARSPIGHALASALRAKRQKNGKQPRRWRGLISIDGGLGALTAAMGERLGRSLVSDTRVEAVRRAERGYEVTVSDAIGAARNVQCRSLVLAVPAVEAERLLEPLVPDAARIIGSIESASLVVLNLGFRRADIEHPMEGYGFLVPHDEPGFPLLGVLWADSVFPHHAPPDQRLIRVFFGGSRDPQAAERSDDELLATAIEAVGDLLQIKGKPTLVDVCRYPAAIPQYHMGHVEKIEGLRAAVATQPGLHVIGNYLEGISLNDTIAFATRVAREISRKTTDRHTRDTHDDATDEIHRVRQLAET